MSSNDVKLPAALERFVAAQVSQGTYRSREAAIVAAVERERRRTEQRAWLGLELQKGTDSPSAGVFDVKDIIRRGRNRMTARERRARG